MIFEGVKLMIVGMTTVMLFLGLMIYCINFVAYLTRKAAAREVETIRKERELLAQNRKKGHQAVTTNSHADEDIAVIAAAVAAFEGERMSRA